MHKTPINYQFVELTRFYITLPYSLFFYISNRLRDMHGKLDERNMLEIATAIKFFDNHTHLALYMANSRDLETLSEILGF